MGTPRAMGPAARADRGRAGHSGAFWLLTCAFGVVMLGTTAPSPLYPAYEARFGFGGLTVTVVYAVFATGVLTALLLGVTSAFFAIAYVGGISIPVLGVGIASRQFGLITTAEAFAPIVGALALAALVRIARAQGSLAWRVDPQ